MRNWDTTDENGVCTSDQDWKDVQTVCKQLDIPCRQVNKICISLYLSIKIFSNEMISRSFFFKVRFYKRILVAGVYKDD